MKIEQDDAPFRPITITLESLAELVILRKALGVMTSEPASEYRMYDDIDTLFKRQIPR